MTHLSDFSYLERCAAWAYLSVFLFYSIYRSDKFKCLSPRSIISGELKSIITLLMILMLLMQFMWDIASTYVKYSEGFFALSATHIISKPFMLWTPSHQTLMMAFDYVECVTFSLQTGVFFLMQCFWNYLSNTYAKKSFMGSLEFKIYVLWAIGSMAMFPVLQWVFRNDVTKREGIPQLVYGCEVLITTVLGMRTNFRFKKLIALSERNNGASNKTIVTRLSYFKDMNMMITVILFSYGATFVILCSDGLTEAKIINSNKFATDTLIANANICTVFLFLLLISVFHPRPQFSRENGETTFSNTRTNNARVNNYIVNEKTNAVSDNNGSDAQYMGSAITTNTKQSSNGNNGGFMRAMSPVTVDYPHSLNNDTIPLTSNAALNRSLSPVESQKMYQNQTRSVAIEDPYNNEPVMFSMMEIANNKQPQRYGSPNPNSHHDMPMHGMNNNRNGTPQRNRYVEDDMYSDMDTGYQQTTAPNRIRRPSWERNNNMSDLHQQQYNDQGDQMVRDWLWQSPERRNP